MSWSDWEYVWKRQQPPVGKDADLTALIETYESKRRKTAKVIVVRDFAEASAGLLVSIGFALTGWHLKKGGWLIAIAVLLILGVTAVFLRERYQARRRQLDPNASMLERLEHELAELRHQRHLLVNVGTWYFLPLIGAIVLFMAAMIVNAPSWSASRDPRYIAGFAAFQALAIGFAWVINRRALRRRLIPRIEELEKLQRHLTSSSEGH